MNELIESIRTRFGDGAAFTAIVYLIGRDIMRISPLPVTAELTTLLLSHTVRFTQTNEAVFTMLAHEAEALNKETLH